MKNKNTNIMFDKSNKNMKHLLQQYAAYNLWANKKILELCSLLNEEQLKKEFGGSFPSLFKTLAHLMEVEVVWWERLKLMEHTSMPGWFTGDFKELSKKLLQTSQHWLTWVNDANEVNLTHVFAYQNSKKEHFKSPVNEVLLHLFNHQTFHRGQIITMLRQLGIDKIPPTDFIVFSRNKK